MTQNVWFIAAIWMALALSASFISIWAGISVALVEIGVGVVAGNLAVGLEGGTVTYRHRRRGYKGRATASRAAIDGVDELSCVAWQRRAHLSCGSRNRSRFA